MIINRGGENMNKPNKLHKPIQAEDVEVVLYGEGNSCN